MRIILPKELPGLAGAAGCIIRRAHISEKLIVVTSLVLLLYSEGKEGTVAHVGAPDEVESELSAFFLPA